MDFADLSKYDDLCSDIFLDDLFLWFKTTKMNTTHRKPRIHAKQILDIIQRKVVEERKPNEAVKEVLELDFFKQCFSDREKQRQEFAQQAKRYLYMYMPNAGYEVSDTQRYKVKGRRTEACLIATKDWHVGDQISFCTGMIATLKPEEDAHLRKRDQDFSVMWSQRKGCTCLFLGPARFVNHDCNANCRFISQGQNAVTFQVVRKITCGEEMTAFYGSHYFGVDNIECRCATCEENGRGYFSPQAPSEDDPANGVRRSRRKRKVINYDDYVTFPPAEPVKRTRAQKEATSMTEAQPHPKHETKPLPKKRDSAVMSIDFLCTNELNNQQRVKLDKPVDLLYDVVMDADMSIPNEEEHMAVRVRNRENYPPSPAYDSSSSPSTEDGSSNESKTADNLQQQQQHPRAEDSVAANASVAEKDDTTRSNTAFKPVKEEERLECVACGKNLQQEEISEQLGCNNPVTAELITWSWTPSAIFTDWRPKRCPRCERHYLIYNHEWPTRRIRKAREKESGNQEAISDSPADSTPNIPSNNVSVSTTTISMTTSSSSRKPKSIKNLSKSKKRTTDPAVQAYVDKLLLTDCPLSPLSEYAGDEDLDVDFLCI